MHLKTTSSPFTEEQVQLLNQLLPTLSAEQKIWLSGYISAQSFASEVVPTSSTEPALSDHSPINATVLYGSQTGNSQSVAETLALRLQEIGIDADLHSMRDYKTKELKSVERLFLIISTHGEGEPPDNAIGFYEHAFSRKMPKLDGVQFSVLSLGDESYEFFCQTGKELDDLFEKLGGERIVQRADCDVDFEEVANEWVNEVVTKMSDNQQSAKAPSTSLTPLTENPPSQYSRSNPYHAEVLENINLNGRGSNKETRHIELSLEDSGFTFSPGDSIGIFPENDELIVHQLLELTNWDGNLEVTINKNNDTVSLREALLKQYEITVLTKPLLTKTKQWMNEEDVDDLIREGNQDQLRDYLEGRDLIDYIKDFGPIQTSAEEFVATLRKIPPRLYSIASSHLANEDEVHLTVSAVRYDLNERARSGVCSVQCAERTEVGGALPIFVQKNDNFRLPIDPDAPIIMVGPGTGVAPYRSFLEEREELDASGKSWLFFGDQHFVTDFLYQVDWQRWLSNGTLTKMDVAFSRDTDEKIYVQHRMKEQSKELYNWIDAGATIYVCGDEKQMAQDVHATLTEIIAEEGNYTTEEADSFLKKLQQEQRYQRDVY
ncbi:assimilatory sulfite reductase (NADPH) flavoprotein subunit [Geomicrobium sp. JCM 19038]|uniref:assimilatory sulfite reductase (NADPH) flavoprotein subunit n=1 Tax=Geomicrobium sp. JCM 19038 TaxID=1460635 RepID=UPI00045F3DDA|nr:assimilatory sulfite reductase (NADPH) flavoprotein subunit [Geomicrobium sp. JCM 19038]GAK09113.1 sulfite reductase [Geomicrobium sp. JCM 19038]